LRVEYIDHLGTDLSVVNAARVSFDKESEWEYNEKEVDIGDGYGAAGVNWQKVRDYDSKRLKTGDVKLINYLAKHNHFTPFTHATVTFRWTVPIFMARQLLKHQIGLSVNEVSRRYVDSDPEFFVPEQWRARHESAKQGSKADEFVTTVTFYDWNGDPDVVAIDRRIQQHNNESLALYKALLESNVCPEQARMVLPQSMYTSFYWTGSLAAWARVFSLRNKPDAQLEHKVLMEQLDAKMKELYPVSWQALTSS
jgi:thymidylate synthase (FAD)